MSKKEPNTVSTVSVAMTTYNGSAFLLEQLQSLADQSRRPDEVIICDDGSSDDTLSLLRQFIQANGLAEWHIVENPNNLGYIRNFHKAVSLTHGDVVFLCDQDDIWDLNKIEKMMSVMEADPEIEALACSYRQIDADSTQLKKAPRKFYIPAPRTAALSKVRAGYVFHYNMAQGCACCYRRILIDQYCNIPCTEELPHDWVLNLLAYQKGAFYFWNEELLSYRHHSGNTIGAKGMVPTIFHRTPQIQKKLDCVEEILNLPISDFDAEEFKRISAFFRLRIQILQTKNYILWIKTFIHYRSLIRKGFFMQYIKDLLLLPLSRDSFIT